MHIFIYQYKTLFYSIYNAYFVVEILLQYKYHINKPEYIIKKIIKYKMC